MKNNEIWKQVIGFKGLYSVSNYGRVRRDVPYRNPNHKSFLKPYKGKNGYMHVVLSKDNEQKYFTVHFLVASNFIGNRLDNFDINHKDGDKKNNNVLNLEYASRSENMKHAFKNRLSTVPMLKGSRNASSKLKENEIIELRRKHMFGFSQISLAKQYNITQANVSCIVRRETWKHI